MANYHFILNHTLGGSNHILCLHEGYQELAYDWALDLTHREALIELKRLYVKFVSEGKTVEVSVCLDFSRFEKVTYRPLDVMDDGALALELLSR